MLHPDITSIELSQQTTLPPYSRLLHTTHSSKPIGRQSRTMSTEAIIAIVALIVGLPPTLLVLWHCIKRCMGMPGSSESSEEENGECRPILSC